MIYSSWMIHNTQRLSMTTPWSSRSSELMVSWWTRDSSTWWRIQKGTGRLWEVGGELGFHGGLTGSFIGLVEVIFIFSLSATVGMRWRFWLGFWAWITSPRLPVDAKGWERGRAGQWSSKTVSIGSAATWPRRRCAVEQVEEEEDDFFFPLPKWYPGPGWLLGRAAGPARWAAPGKTPFPFFVLISFLISSDFCFEFH
jgi:hypothetical protein